MIARGKGPGSSFAVVAGSLRRGEADVMLLARQCLDELGGGCTDVVSLGATHQDRAGDLGRIVFERVLAQGQQVVDRAADAVHELASSQRPPRCRLAGKRLQYPAQHRSTQRLAAGNSCGQRTGDSPHRVGEKVIRAAICDTGGQPVLGAGSPGSEMATEAQADQGDPGRVHVRPRQHVVHDR